MAETHGAISPYTRRVVTTVGVVALATALFLLVWNAHGVFLVVFAGALLAIFLDGLAHLVSDHTPIPRVVSLVLVIVTLLGVIVGGTALLGPSLVQQLTALADQIPRSIAEVQRLLLQQQWGQEIIRRFPPPEEMLSPSEQLGQVTGAFSMLAAAVGGVAIIVFVGLYGAATPRIYVKSLLDLVPPERRERAVEVGDALLHVLRRWLAGRLASMAVVGVLSAVGLWALGVQLALSLGIIAGLLSFIPYVGPILSVVPAALVALVQEPTLALYVLALYLGIQVVESYLVTPLIERQAVSIPPAALIAAQLLLGVLAGALGVVLATPIAVVVTVLVQMLYVEGMLGREVLLLGDKSPPTEA